MRTKLAIIGASYLQEPLIQKAKSMGIETHVFAWAAGDVGEKSADFFYPISIVEKELILEKCLEIGIDGICSIASDLAVITVNYVANAMGLIGNSPESVEVTTNKHRMRLCFSRNGDPSTKSIQVSDVSDVDLSKIKYPVIVKPVDRSGSRGITEVRDKTELPKAIEKAKKMGFEKAALIENFIPGREYSVESISWEGKHSVLALTQKYTTGAPAFIETGHLEPAPIDEVTFLKIKNVVIHALNSLKIKYGASHSEIKISEDGEIRIIEIGARMGGDNIGASLVELSTGYDFLKAVIDVSLGIKPEEKKEDTGVYAGIRFVIDQKDIEVLERMKKEHPEILVDENIQDISNEAVTDSSSRFGYFLFRSKDAGIVNRYLPVQGKEYV